MNFNNVLVICAGNICRSPMAEVLLKQHFPNLQVNSAGLVAMVDHPADEKSQLCMQRLGIDLSNHRAKQITAEDVKQVDVVLTMSTQQQKHLEQLFPFSKGKVFRLGHWQNKDISDPYQKPQEAFDQACQLIQTFIQDWEKFFKV
ncbi:low molecular weight phosphotyrosine protein phosphatase [Acinetobacter qingfengensis]|uniref:protein-tyrosine-phosphatase n=1 Tax=Acinetobacter qingfengensis TaxID=1262585 RepID=A0A1E7RCL3_9GAMM|nr:low molecular weight protein-tyrosine-phosphatase [Acinetobacter qingfengensis]KAA8732069.1 low molecular weight phosphotyrosine protein phosphatase [Acinetobacter qingfengensis]OEY97149.1 protein tyrosine phosphatase [Acinetobacter qingfengensis]